MRNYKSITKIKIIRNTGWIGQPTGIDIYIDGVRIGTINDGGIQDYEVENGKHEIYAKYGLERSQKMELNIAQNEIKILKLAQFKYRTLILVIFIALQHFIFF